MVGACTMLQVLEWETERILHLSTALTKPVLRQYRLPFTPKRQTGDVAEPVDKTNCGLPARAPILSGLD